MGHSDFAARDVAGDLRAHERRVYSQNGEDGIIEEILRRVGIKTGLFVEFGAETGLECNCARLALKEGWGALFIEGNSAKFDGLSRTYAGDDRIRCIRARVSSDNIEQILSGNHIPQEFDLLSIDIDGNDYWVWAAIQNWHPRIVVIEYNASFPPPRLWVMVENHEHTWDGTSYYGASLASLARLGRKKGYSLVATDSRGVNAFFVKADLMIEGRFLDPAVHFHYSKPGYGVRGCGHPKGDGPFVEI